jgi:hypothetical protein
MTFLLVALAWLAFGVYGLFWGASRWQRTGNEWYVIALLLDMVWILIAGHLFWLAVQDVWL